MKMSHFDHDLWPKVTNFNKVRASVLSNHLAKTASKSVHPFGWNFVHKKCRTHTHTDTQTHRHTDKLKWKYNPSTISWRCNNPSTISLRCKNKRVKNKRELYIFCFIMGYATPIMYPIIFQFSHFINLSNRTCLFTSQSGICFVCKGLDISLFIPLQSY